MKFLTTAIAALALVACSGEPTEQTDEPVNESTTETSAPKAQTVSLNISGMT